MYRKDAFFNIDLNVFTPYKHQRQLPTNNNSLKTTTPYKHQQLPTNNNN